MSENNTSGVFMKISNSYQNAFTGAFYEVAFCHGKAEVLNVIEDSMSEEISNFLEDELLYDELMILSQGMQRGEKCFSFEYTDKKTNRTIIVKAMYANKLYKSTYPIFNLSIYDITSLKSEIDSEKQNNMEFEQLTDAMSVGILKLGDEKGFPVLWSNRGFSKNTGISMQDIQTKYKNQMLNLLVEDDRDGFLLLMDKCIETGNLQSGKVSIVTMEGYKKTYEVRVIPSKDAMTEGKVLYCVFYVKTKDMKKVEELINFEELYKTVLSFTSDIVFEYDIEKDIIHYFGGDNSTTQRPPVIIDYMKHLRENTLPIGQLTKESIEEIERMSKLFLKDHAETSDAYLCYYSNTKKECWVYLVAKCIYSNQNKPLVVVGKLTDVTVHKEVEQRLLIKANTDSLTQVSNREYAEEEIKKYLKKHNPEKYYALLILDVDNFKNINDLYGHQEGDKVLVNICSILRSEFRSSDVVGRLGGDEFIVFMKDVAEYNVIMEKAKTVCKKVRKKLHSVSVSIGISASHGNKSFDELYKTADIALYQAKIRGKNTAVCYDDLDEMDRQQVESSVGTIGKYAVSEGSDKDELIPSVESGFAKNVLDSFEYIYAVNLTQNKVRRFNEEQYPESEHNFKTYLEMFDHLNSEIFDREEQIDFIEYFSRDNLMQAFLNGERFVHRYIRIINHMQEFHWYFVEAVLMESNERGDILCTITLKDVQKSRNDEMRKYETRTMHDIIQTLENEKSFDSLTGLYQANKFYEMAKTKIWSNVNRKYAIISFDVDRFRIINDLYSEETGDQIICYIAEVLRRLYVEDKVFCRYYADCFTLLVSYDSRKDIIQIIDWIREECAKTPYISTTFKMSFGVYLVVDPSIPIRLMCDWARLATKSVKGLSNQYFAFYNEEYRKELMETQKIEAEMHRALKNGEFKMYLQPKYNLRTNQLVGAEALVRWQHPVEGIIFPNKFIKLFEKNGFILQLDEYIWEQACKELRSWLDQGITYPISVNISRLHTYDPALVQKLIALTNKYSIPVHLLELEFTEGLFMENVHMLYGLMYDLKKQGFVLQMDDFGSGFSSLNMLKSVPIDVIKLDKAFFEDITENTRGKIIIEDSIKMIHNLNLEVMAEGIETKEHVELLNQCDCVIGQGYYYAKPMSKEEFDAKLIMPVIKAKGEQSSENS